MPTILVVKPKTNTQPEIGVSTYNSESTTTIEMTYEKKITSIFDIKALPVAHLS